MMKLMEPINGTCYPVKSSEKNKKVVTNPVLSQEKDMFDECNETPNSPHKRVHNEILKTHLKSSDNDKIDL